MTYRVQLKILNYNETWNRFEFNWYGSFMISKVEEVTLLVEGLNESNVYDSVMQGSEGSLEILEISEDDNNAKEAAEEIRHLCEPIRNSDIIYIARHNSSVGKN